MHRDTIELLGIAVLQTSLLQTCGHLTRQTSTWLNMPSGQSSSSVCMRPKSMTSTSCNSVLSPCGVDWSSALWIMPLICGNVIWEPVSTPKADILNITPAYKLFVRIICQYFNAFIQTFQCSCEKQCCFLICTVVCLHTWRSETIWYPKVPNSLLVNLVQKLLKSVNICKSYCKNFTGTFFMDHSVQQQQQQY